MIQCSLHSTVDVHIDFPACDNNEEPFKQQPQNSIVCSVFDEQILCDEQRELALGCLSDCFNSHPQPSLAVSSFPSNPCSHEHRVTCNHRSLLQSSVVTPGGWTRTTVSSYDPTARRLYNRSMSTDTM
ncbi:hypothetical protein GUITHDRAFT_153059, partial [Guillardia theta CCMP2712]